MKKLLLFLLFVIMTVIANAQWQQTSLDSDHVESLTSKGDTIFAGTNSSIYMSTNNGGNWAEVNNGLPATNQTMSLAIKGNSIFAGTSNGVYSSSNNGSGWTASNNGLVLSNTNVFAFAVSDSIIFAGTYNGVFSSSNNGSNWYATSLSNVIMSLSFKGDTLFAGTNGYDGIYLSTNNGSSWDSVNTGLTGSDLLVFALAQKGSNIFAGTCGGGVFLSTNNGNSWVAVNTGLNNKEVYAISIWGNKIFAGTYGGGIFMSSNNGNSWSAINYGLPLNPSVFSLTINGNYIFAGTVNNGVWRLPLSEIGIVEEINNNAGNIAVYPNPAINYITIKSLQKSILEILNIQGQTIRQQQIQQGKTNIDISGLEKGVYILRLCSNDKTEVARIVKE
jgi:photosystem II stability/assembly factor-like uncharacterized protein